MVLLCLNTHLINMPASMAKNAHTTEAFINNEWLSEGVVVPAREASKQLFIDRATFGKMDCFIRLSIIYPCVNGK